MLPCRLHRGLRGAFFLPHTKPQHATRGAWRPLLRSALPRAPPGACVPPSDQAKPLRPGKPQLSTLLVTAALLFRDALQLRKLWLRFVSADPQCETPPHLGGCLLVPPNERPALCTMPWPGTISHHQRLPPLACVRFLQLPGTQDSLWLRSIAVPDVTPTWLPVHPPSPAWSSRRPARRRPARGPAPKSAAATHLRGLPPHPRGDAPRQEICGQLLAVCEGPLSCSPVPASPLLEVASPVPTLLLQRRQAAKALSNPRAPEMLTPRCPAAPPPPPARLVSAPASAPAAQGGSLQLPRAPRSEPGKAAATSPLTALPRQQAGLVLPAMQSFAV
mmetsp:Transcript_35795/g.66754  ORF Transcript_35795/g.66754 Transcript_35795/m.66754 type:complete len:332 (-) Transcript_35795:421-1416(-)